MRSRLNQQLLAILHAPPQIIEVSPQPESALESPVA
jgi:hypothetical protein